MPLSNFTRPDLPYVNAPLPNDNRFNVITRTLKQPIKDDQLDGEFNSSVDRDNVLDNKIEAVVAGNIPGSNNPLNANKLLTTDGAGTLSFIEVTDNNIQDQSLTASDKLVPFSILSDNLANGLITPNKIPNNSLPYSKMDFNNGDIPYEKLNVPDDAIPYAKVNVLDGAIPYVKLNIPNGTIPGAKLVNKSITQAQQGLLSVGTPELIDRSVTVVKIGSGASLANTFLAADGAGNATFIDKIGRILQIVNFEINNAIYDENPCSPANPISFTVPFRLNITPLKTGSKIILYYSANISGGGNSYYAVVLCRNNAIWKVGTAGGAGGFDGGVTNGGYVANPSDNQYGTPCFSNIFVDTGTVGQQITYELKKALQYVTLNRSAYDRLHTISTMVAIEVDI